MFIALALFITPRLSAQYLTRPQIPWRTITTQRFDFHFPAEMEEWTRSVAQRMESVADAVNAVVGNQPTARITVLVEDPSNVANGFALPFMEGPVIFLWPTPPSPSPTFGTHRGWGEALAVHEYGHIAHLTFPSRNSRERFWWKLAPTQLSPVARKSPAWVIEGYATLIEGQLTGSGRPFSSGRAAVLRQWALEGRFPTYGQLNGSPLFLGGNMRYLVGSAFLEWLQQRKGDSSLVHVWRRMSARQQRSFDESFAGVFGASPAEMYGAFSVDVTERALQVRNRLRAAGLVEGTLVQRMTGSTGEPAISPDGSRIAIVQRSLGGPSRLVVWETRPSPDSALQHARQRMLQLDSLDVAPFDSFPRPKRALATLLPVNGRSHELPRWMPDGINLLVSRDEPAPNGVTRPDLFVWNTRTKELKRVTYDASIRQADPAPNGREAVGVRCNGGTCSLVIVTVSTGSWRVLAAGTPDLVWHRPRYSADGRWVAAGYQTGGQWNVALVDASTGAMRQIPADEGISRYAPSFTADGKALVVVSDRGGIANLESVPVDSGAPQTLSRVTGAVLAPDVNRADGSIWFLTMRSGGLDLRRVAPGETLSVVAIQGSLAPVVPPTAVIPGIASSTPGVPVQVRDYGLGPRRWRVLPGGTAGPDGFTGLLMGANIDPIGRLSLVGQAAYSTPGSWRGASALAAYRRLSVDLDGSVWYFENEPSRSRDHLAPLASDIRYAGASAMGTLANEGSSSAYLLRAGVQGGTVSNALMSDAGRLSIMLDARGRLTRTFGINTGTFIARGLAERGETDGESWRRNMFSASLSVGNSRQRLRGEWTRGAVDEATGPGRALEQFVVGGSSNPLVDPSVLSQRLALPAVPPGLVSGRRIEMFRLALGVSALEPWFVWVAAGDSLSDRKRVAGIEQNFSIASLAFVRLPAVRARAGASWSFDEPYGNRPRLYASLSYTP